METITHKNLTKWLDKLAQVPYLQIGSNACYDNKGWYAQTVTLEFPIGELCKDGLTTIALIGFTHVQPTPLTGKEGFDAQGLEGKIQIKKPLINALLNLRDILPINRGRIVFDK